MSAMRTNDEWKAILSPEQFRVLRQRGTEAPNTGKYIHTKDAGTYNCGACDAPLYVSATKFDSGCGWPAFFDAIPGAIMRIEDTSCGMARTEIVCSNCQSHLGHVFQGEGFPTLTDERHCVNSISLNFRPENKADDPKV
ncbi:Peptide methionine sulfoxide reductase B2, chloroplastic [Coemansia sp. RSA 2559]|nr:Peptide methionine sulfoxide reductase B2, chloroplastic [Coemansia sp. RSA 2559]